MKSPFFASFSCVDHADYVAYSDKLDSAPHFIICLQLIHRGFSCFLYTHIATRSSMVPDKVSIFAWDKPMSKEAATLVDVVHYVVRLEDVRQNTVQTVESRNPSTDKSPDLEDALLHLSNV